MKEFYWALYRLWANHISMFPRKVKWFIQRGRRGYADCDVWDLGDYLMTMLPEALKQFRENMGGYPPDMTFEEWESKLKNIESKLRSYQAIDNGLCDMTPEEFHETYRTAREGLHDMADIIRQLWD